MDTKQLDKQVSAAEAENDRRDLLSRRKWLGSLATVAMAAPILPLFNRFNSARAQTVVRPQNLILVYHQNGFEVTPPWWTTTTNAMMQTVFADSDGRLNSLNDPLLLGRVTAIAGIQNGISNEVLAHSQGSASMWTGFNNVSAGGTTYSPYNSIDHQIGDRISAGLAFRNLHFGVRSQQNFGAAPTNNENNTSFRNGAPVPHQDDPNQMFMRMFSGAGSPAELMAARARRQSVLDIIRRDLGRIRTAYSTAEQVKIDEHLNQIREVERRLTVPLSSTCNPSTFTSNVPSNQIHQDARTVDVIRLQQQLLQMALRCGLTRVCSWMYFSSLSNVITPANPSMGVHACMHAGSAQQRRGLNRYFTDHTATLARNLAMDVDPTSGRSLLDDTVIAWSTDMAVGNHLPHPVPLFLIGGDRQNGFFRPGMVNLLSGPDQMMNGGRDRIQHTRVLLSILEAFNARDGRVTLGDYRDAEFSVGPFTMIHR